jgi:hypothetical protein
MTAEKEEQKGGGGGEEFQILQRDKVLRSRLTNFR